MKKNVYVTGIGIMSPLAIGVEEHKEAFLNAKCSIESEKAVGNNFPKIVGVVPDFKPQNYIDDKKSIRMMNRHTVLGSSATRLAMLDAKLTSEDIQSENDEENAVMFGSGASDGIMTFREAAIRCTDDQGNIDYEKLGLEGYRMLPPLWILPKLPNTTSGQMSIQNSIRGLSYSIVNESFSGFSSIGEAHMSVESGRIARVFCGGAEGTIYTDFFNMMKKHNISSDTKDGSKAFDSSSDGAILSEGSAVLILEDEDKAKARDAKVYGSILSYCSGYVPNYKEEDIESLSIHYEKIMRRALEEASLKVEDIDFIQASACGIKKNDFAEALAIKNIFGKKPYITTAHSSIGHTLAASGPISVSFALIQLCNSLVAPIVRGENLFLEEELNYVKNEAVKHESKVTLVNSFDYCGNIGTIILSKVGRL